MRRSDIPDRAEHSAVHPLQSSTGITRIPRHTCVRVPGLQPTDSLGLTLVEVLVAMLVIAIGLIGIAALYGDVAQSELDTQPETEAARLAEAMVERVKANSAGRTGYASVVGVVCVTGNRDKRPVSAAAQEAACWHNEVEQKLPNGTGSITRDLSTAPPTYIVAVSWSAPGSGAASYVVRVQP
jgi:type IV pilus assembly protein PilV